jgi:hypothetical protein
MGRGRDFGDCDNVLARDKPCHCWPSQECRDGDACEHPECADGVLSGLKVRFEDGGGFWLLGVTNYGILRGKVRLDRLYIPYL